MHGRITTRGGELRRYREAVQVYDMAIKYKPDHANAYYAKGVALRKLGEDSKSTKAFDTAIKYNPDLPKTYKKRGMIFNKLRDWYNQREK